MTQMNDKYIRGGGQSLILHSSIFDSSPSQVPPKASSWIFTRVLIFIPLPQVSVQGPSFQVDQIQLSSKIQKGRMKTQFYTGYNRSNNFELLLLNHMNEKCRMVVHIQWFKVTKSCVFWIITKHRFEKIFKCINTVGVIGQPKLATRKWKFL